MGRERKYVINGGEAESYSPPRHKDTVNYRLSGKGGLPSQNLEILLGELKKGSEAEWHYHKGSEQAIFVVEGTCDLAFQDGTEEKAAKEDLIFLPKGLGHRLVVTSDNFRALIIYSPILDENDMLPIPLE